MGPTTLSLSPRQLFTLRQVLGTHLDMHLLGTHLDMHFDNMEGAPDAHALLELQVLVDVCDKVDVQVPRQVRSFLADRR